MDAGHINKTRKFPAYSLKELEATVAKFHAGELTSFSTAETIAQVEQEIANRKAGISIAFVVPQIR